MSIKIKSFVAAVALAGAGMVGAQPASAATAGPTVKLTQPTFTTVQTEGPLIGYPMYWDIGFTLHWTVAAPAGVCKQTITYQDYDTEGGPTDPMLGGATQTDTIANAVRSWFPIGKLNNGTDFVDWSRGGFTAVIRVTDCHGVQAASNVVHVVIQPGDNTDYPQMSYFPFVGTNGNLGWAVANCTCFLGGSSTWTSRKGASVSFMTPQSNDPSGVRVALIMPKGPGRGSAALYVDNKYKTTINTYHAGSNVNGIINYQFLLTGMNTHLVRVVNLATAGHPRIDVDATINGG